MFCPRPALLNPGATPAVLSQPRRKHPSAERFVHRPTSAQAGSVLPSIESAIGEPLLHAYLLKTKY